MRAAMWHPNGSMTVVPEKAVEQSTQRDLHCAHQDEAPGGGGCSPVKFEFLWRESKRSRYRRSQASMATTEQGVAGIGLAFGFGIQLECLR